MVRLASIVLITVVGVAVVSAEDDPYYVVSTADQSDDWAPGESGSDDWDGTPACESMQDVGVKDCVAGPDTPATSPPVAPDNCQYYDWTYDAEIYMLWGCG